MIKITEYEQGSKNYSIIPNKFTNSQLILVGSEGKEHNQLISLKKKKINHNQIGANIGTISDLERDLEIPGFRVAGEGRKWHCRSEMGA